MKARTSEQGNERVGWPSELDLPSAGPGLVGALAIYGRRPVAGAHGAHRSRTRRN